MEGFVYLLQFFDTATFEAGTGWEEEWLPADLEMDRPGPTLTLRRCAWCGGWMVYEDGDLAELPGADMYNRWHEGRRIWIGNRYPTAGERAAAPWVDGDGGLCYAPKPGQDSGPRAKGGAACAEDYCDVRLE